MKRVTFFIFTLFFLSVPTTNAQQVVPDTLREGNLVYLSAKNQVWKYGTESLKGRSRGRDALSFTIEHIETILKPAYRSAFSKERAKELGKSRLIVRVYFDTIEKRIVKLSFYWPDKEKAFPFRLSELSHIEDTFRKTSKLIPPIKNEGEILNHPMLISFPIDFYRLYQD